MFPCGIFTQKKKINFNKRGSKITKGEDGLDTSALNDAFNESLDQDQLRRIEANLYHSRMADNYFSGDPGVMNYLKGAYHWMASTPYLLGENEERIVPLTGVAPAPSNKAPFSLKDFKSVLQMIRSRGGNRTSLGDPVKIVNGIKYYKDSLGQIKTAQEIAKSAKMARDARILEAILYGKDNVKTGKVYSDEIKDLELFLKDPAKFRKNMAFGDWARSAYDQPTGGVLMTTSSRIGDFGRGKRR